MVQNICKTCLWKKDNNLENQEVTRIALAFRLFREPQRRGCGMWELTFQGVTYIVMKNGLLQIKTGSPTATSQKSS